MTTPPDDFENDPTGMRDLLRSLPDPGPMPQDVADRIAAALAAEHAGRAEDDRSNVTPMTRTGRSSKPAGRRWMQAVGGVAAAAAVAAVAVVGINSLQQDNAPTSAVPSGGTHRSVSTDELADRVQVESTGTSYTGASFNTQAASMATGSKTSRIPAQELLTQFGALTKPRAIIGCVRTVGGSLLDDPSSIKVDLATYDGKPALIVVVTDDGKRTAFAVSSSCSKGDKPYAAPRSV
ncbi:hypothetical protein [Flexivirga endophytica]|uniref:hypothetical protein n=1 Tax=Flexivirga endophytica TaxID=1849103 RepID=UPI0016641EBF|nr:hypothetical protein [Flexivirga endophytica]